MKQKLLFLLIACNIASCNTMKHGDVEVQSDESYTMEYRYGDIGSPSEAIQAVRKTIRFVPDKGEDYWQLPHETIERGAGDCEDISILLLYLLGSEINFDLRNLFLLIVYDSEYKSHHTVVLFKYVDTGVNYYSDVSTNHAITQRLVEKYSVEYKIPYGEVFWMTANYHNSVGQYF